MLITGETSEFTRFRPIRPVRFRNSDLPEPPVVAAPCLAPCSTRAAEYRGFYGPLASRARPLAGATAVTRRRLVPVST